MKVRFCPIASGSSGNCIYISTGNTSILIDAGISGKRIEAGLNSIGASCIDIDGLFVTHEHSDHIQGAGVLTRRYDMPVYATKGTWDGMMNGYKSIGPVVDKNMRVVIKNEPFRINDITVTPFSIPHDAGDPVGYSINAGGAKICVATDIGHITPEVIEAAKESNILLLESNHDIEMLRNGSYPYILKKRIAGDYGHLSNVSCGQLLLDVVSEKLRHVYLGHLSEENNRPMLAYDTVSNYLAVNNIHVGSAFELHLADRHKASKLVELMAEFA